MILHLSPQNVNIFLRHLKKNIKSYIIFSLEPIIVAQKTKHIYLTIYLAIRMKKNPI